MPLGNICITKMIMAITFLTTQIKINSSSSSNSKDNNLTTLLLFSKLNYFQLRILIQLQLQTQLRNQLKA